MKKKKAFSTKIKTVGYGYVGKWKAGSLGWFLPNHLEGVNYVNEPPNPNENFKKEKAYLCKITVEQVFDKLGRPIVRRTGEPHA